MKRLELTGLGNGVDIASGASVFIAVFDRTLRVPISKEAADLLTAYIYSEAEPQKENKPIAPPAEEQSEESLSGFSLGEVPSSVHDDEMEDGVESI